jgi:probable phosphoglycerate mutase
LREHLPQIFIARHGQTAWSLSGQHTGRTDLPLTADGEQNAIKLGRRLGGMTFAHVFSSPSQRARRTGELAGFGAQMRTDPDLAEWDYGEYEGVTSAEIHKTRPDWLLFRDGCPGGESVTQISARADRVVKKLRDIDADVIIFSSGHFSRVLAARWLGIDASAGRLFVLGTGSLSTLSYEHNRNNPAILLWNDRDHLEQKEK